MENPAAIRFSIILPCYNEAENLPLLLARYREVWQDELLAELILVNNGSTDDTAHVLKRELSRPEFAFARTVNVPKNRGYGHGVFTGLQSARGEFIGFSHADMQCSPADLFWAYTTLIQQPEPIRALVKGKRARRGLNAQLMTSTMSVLASTILVMRLTDINAQPKVFHCSHLNRVTSPPDGFEFDLYVLYTARRAGVRILTIPVLFGPRAHGKSKWSFSFFSRYRTILATVRFIFHLRLGAVR